MSELADKGTHLEDSSGKVFAKASSNGFTKPRKKKMIFRSAADWDVVFMAYGEVMRGRITRPQLAKITGISLSTIGNRAKKESWDARWNKTLALQGEPTALEPIRLTEKISAFQAQHPDGVDWLENLNKMFKKTGKHLSKMSPHKVLEHSSDIKNLHSVAAPVYGMDNSEEEKASQRPAINIQFLMQATAEPKVVNG